jgi:galactonate dehydratase
MEEQNMKNNISRRLMLKGLGLGAASGTLAFLGSGQAFGHTFEKSIFPVSTNTAIRETEAMKIVKVESIRFSDKISIGGGSGGSGRAEFCWIRIHTNTGIIGIGETYPSINGELGSLKDIADEYLIGKDPRDTEGIWKEIYKYQSMRNAGGSEMHILSAIDMALLDILGKSTGLPLYRLLGGKTRSRVKVYNTTTDYWSINNMKMGADTEKIVTFLLDRGITGIKIYPFRTNGSFISSVEIEKGIAWLKQIEKTAGKKMEILIDGWGGCDVPSAERVIKACEPYNVIHIEDILLPNSLQSYAKLAEETFIPIAHSETLATRYQLKDFLEAGASCLIYAGAAVLQKQRKCATWLMHTIYQDLHILAVDHYCMSPPLTYAQQYLIFAIWKAIIGNIPTNTPTLLTMFLYLWMVMQLLPKVQD